MLLYVTLGTNDLARAGRFYDPVLATLSIDRAFSDDSEHGYRPQGDSRTRIWVTKPFDGKPATQGNGSMLALTATSNADVEAFHQAALANGGTDDGAPGYRYRPGFYACYVRDPDGNKLSAVCENPT